MYEKYTKEANNIKDAKTKEILQSFIDNPIVDPTAPVGLDSVVEQAAKMQPKQPRQQAKIIEEAAPVKQQNSSSGLTLDTQLIEYIIKKTVEETMTQMSQKTAIDETIQIKIGDKVFGGKLTVLKENKK